MHVKKQLTLNSTSSISSTGVASAAIARKGTRHPPTRRRCPPMAVGEQRCCSVKATFQHRSAMCVLVVVCGWDNSTRRDDAAMHCGCLLDVPYGHTHHTNSHPRQHRSHTATHSPWGCGTAQLGVLTTKRTNHCSKSGHNSETTPPEN